MENEIENVDSPNDETLVTDETNDSGQDTETIESLQEKNKKLFARAKKAEGFELKDGKWLKKPEAVVETPKPAPSNQDNLSLQDSRALNKVEDEDVDDVIEYAKFKNISVADALKTPTLSALLATKAEERRTAAAAHTRGGARGSSKVSGEDLLRKAKLTGEVPTSDEGMQELFIARRAQKVAKI